jgi:hypothetical protein
VQELEVELEQLDLVELEHVELDVVQVELDVVHVDVDVDVSEQLFILCFLFVLDVESVEDFPDVLIPVTDINEHESLSSQL